jgi:hypothetical protein
MNLVNVAVVAVTSVDGDSVCSASVQALLDARLVLHLRLKFYESWEMFFFVLVTGKRYACDQHGSGYESQDPFHDFSSLGTSFFF